MEIGFGLALPLPKDRAGERESVVLMKPEPALLRRRLQSSRSRFLFVHVTAM